MREKRISSIIVLSLLMLSVFLLYQEEADAQAIDWIDITNLPNGTALGTVILGVGEQVTAYASGYNISFGYVDLVEVNWSGSGGSWSPITGNSSTFTAGSVPGTYIQTGQNTSLGLSDIFSVTILPPEVDWIQIVDSPGGGSVIPDTNIDIGQTVTGYAAAYNYTVGYIFDVSVSWSVNNVGSNASTNPNSGNSSNFFSGYSGGTAIWTAEYPSNITDTVVFSIYPDRKEPDIGCF
jgi:hypothetical protein